MMPSKHTLIIDSSFLCHRAVHAMKGRPLSHGELRTEVIFSFLNQVRDIAEQTGAKVLAFAWDSRRSYRKQVYKGYKKKEVKEDLSADEARLIEVLYEQVDELREFIVPGLGFRNSFILTGLEADDIMASLVRNNEGWFTIASTDADLYQLLSPRVRMYNPIKKRFFTEEDLVKKWGVEAKDWGKVKTIAGCLSDKVPGVPGVKEKTAIKFLTSKLKSSAKAYQNIMSDEGWRTRNRNKRLVVLPFEGTPVLKLTEQELYVVDFIRIFEMYGIKSFLSATSLQRWERVLDLNPIPKGASRASMS